MGLDSMSLQEIWDVIQAKAKAHPENIEGLNATYAIQLTGDKQAAYLLTFEKDSIQVDDQINEKVDCTLTMSIENFKKLLQGNLNTTGAFMTGKLKVKGNIGLALKLENTLKKFSF